MDDDNVIEVSFECEDPMEEIESLFDAFLDKIRSEGIIGVSVSAITRDLNCINGWTPGYAKKGVAAVGAVEMLKFEIKASLV